MRIVCSRLEQQPLVDARFASACLSLAPIESSLQLRPMWRLIRRALLDYHDYAEHKYGLVMVVGGSTHRRQWGLGLGQVSQKP